MEEMLKQYYKGEEGSELIIDELGFCAYTYDEEYKSFFVRHVFMPKDKRKESDKFFNKIRFRAKSLGAKSIAGALFMNEHNRDEYTKKVTIFLLNGFRIVAVDENMITVTKEI